jgi:hypothetical protein
VARAISAGSDHSMAIDASGVVRCWGWNYFGQSSVPADMQPVTSIAATMYGSIALQEDGSVRTWGLIAAPAETPSCVEEVVGGGFHALIRSGAFPCPTCSDADTNLDGVVDGNDLGVLLSEWGAATEGSACDINQDGFVNGADLGFLLSFWGACP